MRIGLFLVFSFEFLVTPLIRGTGDEGWATASALSRLSGQEPPESA